MSEKSSDNKRIALLIDGDNAQPSLVKEIIAEAGKYGLITIRRIYGDWTTTSMNSWKDSLNIHSIQPMQQFRYTVGKNATDSSMIIDAMDTLYEGAVDGFCLVSSDSDYTRLAMRIREKGLFVMGIGKSTTPKAFANACEVFVFTENLGSDTEAEPAGQTENHAEQPQTRLPYPTGLLKKGMELSSQDDEGWAFLGVLGSQLRKLDPSFDTRSYGYKQLSHMVRSSREFETKREKAPDGSFHFYVKLRGSSSEKRAAPGKQEVRAD